MATVYLATDARSHDITPDGSRFIAIVTGAADDSPATELIVVENWMEEVRERLAN